MGAPAGDCRSEIDGYCSGVQPGEGRLADCLTQQLLVQEQPKGSTPRPFTDACRAELDLYRRSRAGSINSNLPLGEEFSSIQAITIATNDRKRLSSQ